MIHDGLVVGISDETLSEFLCMDAEEKAKTMNRQCEAVHEQRDILPQSGSTKNTTTLDQVKSMRSRHTGCYPVAGCT